MILKSLPPSFDGFVMNYNMHGMNKTLTELFAMLKVAERDIQKNTNNVLLVKHSTQFKKKKSGSKKKGKSKGTGSSRTPTKDRPEPKADAECFFCKEKGHWKRNCLKYLAENKKIGFLSYEEEIFPSIKLDLLLKVFDKFKELTMMILSLP
jgi:hypothetical protein